LPKKLATVHPTKSLCTNDPEHAQQECTFLCKNCRIVICPMCISSGKHQNHTFVLLSNEIQFTRERLGNLVGITAALARLTETAKPLDILDTHYKKQIAILDESKIRLKKEISERHRDLKTQLDKERENIQKQIQDQNSQMQFLSDKIKKTAHDAEQFSLNSPKELEIVSTPPAEMYQKLSELESILSHYKEVLTSLNSVF